MTPTRLLSPVFVAVIALLSTGSLIAAGTVKSGPQIGERVPGSFSPLNVNGPDAGQKSCLYCRYGTRPVAMIFARDLNPQVITLLKRLEAAAAAHAEQSLGACVIFCNDSQELPAQLAQVAKQEKLDHVILATVRAAGPPRYKIASDADVTVLLYTHCSVKSNCAFKKGELTEAGVDAFLGDLKLILSPD